MLVCETFADFFLKLDRRTNGQEAVAIAYIVVNVQHTIYTTRISITQSFNVNFSFVWMCYAARRLYQPHEQQTTFYRLFELEAYDRLRVNPYIPNCKVSNCY